MRLRAFDSGKDFFRLKSWITDERSHILWCANRFHYPLEKGRFLAELAEMPQDIPLAAVTEDDQAVGFFCYSLNRQSREGKIKFVIVDPVCRGKGTARQMLHLAADRAFEDSDTEKISLAVFSENPRAKACYLKAGFTERETEQQVFSYHEERWSRCHMDILRENWKQSACR